MSKHYGDRDGLLLLSKNAIVNMVLSNRNYGKTWAFQKRAFRRAMKRGKKTIWLRMFDKEVKEASAKMYKSRDLLAYCGASLHSKQNPNGNIKKEGNTFYYRRRPSDPWRWFLQLFKLSDADAVRSADDVDVDTIVFDEFSKTPHKLKMYRGNVVNDFLDIWFSAKREHAVKCILIGNREAITNPFFTYFGIAPLRSSYEGIRTYREGSIAVQQINNVQKEDSDFGRKTRALLKGTSYGNYIYKNEYKGATGLKPRKTPANASIYVQLYINGFLLKISVLNGYFYVNGRVDKMKPIYCDVLPNKWRNERKLVKRNKRFFYAFVDALSDNRVYYDGDATREAIAPFYQWLGI